MSTVQIYCKSSSDKYDKQPREQSHQGQAANKPLVMNVANHQSTLRTYKPRRRIKLRFLLLLLVLLMSTAWWQEEKVSSTENITQLLHADMEQLWAMKQDWQSEGEVWEIRWQLDAANADTAKWIADSLFADTTYNKVAKRVTNKGRTISANVRGLGKVSIHQLSDEASTKHMSENIDESVQVGGYPIAVVWSSEEWSDQAAITKQQLFHATKKISQLLSTQTAAPQYNIKLHIATSSDRSLSQLARGAQAALADDQEQYSDEQLESGLYYTPLIKTHLFLSNGSKANLQLALFSETGAKPSRLTIGVPAISGEF